MSGRLWVIVGAIATFALAVLGLASVKQYWVRESMGVVEALWHGDEAFIAIGLNRQGESGSYLTRLEWAVESWLSPYGLLPAILRHDVLLFHLGGRELRRYTIEGVSPGSGFMVYQGVLHRSVGGNPPRAWRWTGSRFEPLRNGDLDDFRRSLDSSTARLPWERWSQSGDIAAFRGSERVFSMELASGRIDLKITKPGGDNLDAQMSRKAFVVTVSGAGLPETTLYSFDQTWKEVASTVYLEFSQAPEGPDGALMRASKSGH